MTDALSLVLGQDVAITTLRRGLERNSVHHAYMFEGPAGVGKERAAFGLAQALVCEKREPKNGIGACGTCSACMRALPSVETRTPLHPDVVVLETALYPPDRIGRRTPETQEISIDQVRSLVLSRNMFGPHEGRAKVFIIRRCDELSISAANALLKTLEEPLDRTHFILLNDERPLLPTIRSRTLRVRFPSLPTTTLAKILETCGHPTIAQEVLIAANGSVIRALELLDPEATAANVAFYNQWNAAIAAPSLEAGLALGEVEKKEKVLAAHKLAYALTQTGIEVREATLQGNDATAQKKLANYDAIATAIDHLDRNASTQLALETALLASRQ